MIKNGMSFFKVCNHTKKHEIYSYWEQVPPPIKDIDRIIMDYGWSKNDTIVSTNGFSEFILVRIEWEFEFTHDYSSNESLRTSWWLGNQKRLLVK